NKRPLPAQPGKIFRPEGRAKAIVNHSGHSLAAISGNAGAGGMAAKAKDAEAEAKDEPEAAEGEGAQVKRKLPLKLIAIAAAGLLVLAGGGTAGYLFFFRGKPEEKVAAPVVKPVAFFDMPEVMVNLSGATGERVQYLKLKIVLELPDQTMGAQIQPV